MNTGDTRIKLAFSAQALHYLSCRITFSSARLCRNSADVDLVVDVTTESLMICLFGVLPLLERIVRCNAVVIFAACCMP